MRVGLARQGVPFQILTLLRAACKSDTNTMTAENQQMKIVEGVDVATLLSSHRKFNEFEQTNIETH